jgi:hypothetical protein
VRFLELRAGDRFRFPHSEAEYLKTNDERALHVGEYRVIPVGQLDVIEVIEVIEGIR